jgi:hypothetical protein
MNWKILSVIVVASMLFLVLPLASAERKMSIEVQTHRPYYNYEIGDYTRYASFYLFQGEDIRWWQGGAIFLYYLPSEVAREKIDTLTRHMLELFKDLGFVIVSGVVKVTYVKVIYSFDGVLLYEGYYFADEDGRITIEWAIDKPLNITIEAKATIDASTAEYVGRGDWRIREYNGGRGILWPELEIPMPQKEVELLVVPREGFSGITTEVHNYWSNETRIFYLGGGAEVYRVEPHYPGYVLKDSGTFWARYPIIQVKYSDGEKEVLVMDWFWSSKIPM